MNSEPLKSTRSKKRRRKKPKNPWSGNAWTHRRKGQPRPPGSKIHPLAWEHVPGTRWRDRTVARVVNYAVFNSVRQAAQHFRGVPYETIARWVVEIAKPSPEKYASNVARMERIKVLGEHIIYEQFCHILERLKRVGGLEAASTLDQASVARALSQALNNLGATAQRFEMADTTTEVREARRRADQALAEYENESTSPTKRKARRL